MRQFSFIFSGLALVLAAAALTHSLRSNDRIDFDIPQLAQMPGFYPVPAGPTGFCPAGACATDACSQAADPPTAFCPPVTTAAVSSPEALECSSEETESECAVGRCGIDFDFNSVACPLCSDSIDDNIQAFEQLLRLELETANSPEPKYIELHKAIVKCLDASKLDQAASLLEELAKERSGTPEGERAAAALAQLKGPLPTPPEALKSAPEPLKSEAQPLKATPQND